MDEIQTTRKLSGPLGLIQRLILVLIPVIGIFFIVDVPRYFESSIPQGQYLGVFLALILGAVYLTVPPTKTAARDKLPWYDLILAALGLLVGLYLTVKYDEILVQMGQVTPERLIMGIIAIVLVFEANRRASGWVLVIVGAVFLLYAIFADHAPGGFSGSAVAWPQLVNYVYVDTNALLGVPLAVAATVVLSFIFFGQVLAATGAGEFFTEFASATVGKYRGGAAKISVAASSLFGTISGSAVSNVVVDGVFTIRLMKQSGYRAPVAGAVEAVASTGGQLMPPVMGAAAFLIAQFLRVPFRDVAIAALFPALLYYICLYVQVDLEAARYGLRGAEMDRVSKVREVLRRGWRFAIPLLSLIGIIFFAGLQESQAGVAAGALGIILGFIQPELRNLRWIIDTLEKSSRVLLEVGVVVCMAGFIIGAMQVSGLAFILSNALINLAAGNVAVLLLLTAIVALILGMGMPTTAVYLLLAVMVAPALVQLGVPAISAHLFVFYFGMLSMITPPVCLAAFAAAAIARASMWQTGFAAMRLAGVAYIVPFMFVASPALLLRGSLDEILIAAITAIIGTVLLGMALVGYFVRDLGWFQRLAIGLSGVALIVPHSISGEDSWGWLVNVAGFVVVAPILLREWRKRPAQVVTPSVEAGAL